MKTDNAESGRISRKIKAEMRSKTSTEKRIKQLQEEKDKFMSLSRQLAEMAQRRESVTEQPKEYLSGTKGIITIKNYLGGFYYFTADEVEVKGKDVYLIEAKHSKGSLPAIGDIKDGLIKMILFTNLENVKMDDKDYNPKPVLKLTIENHFDSENLTAAQKRNLELLNKEAKTNGFAVKII